MSKKANELKENLNQNIDEVFGATAHRSLKWHVGKQQVERLRVKLPKGKTIQKRELIGLSEIMMYWKFTDLDIDKCKTGIKVEFSI